MPNSKLIYSVTLFIALIFTSISSQPALSQNRGADDKFNLTAFPNPSSSSITINYELSNTTSVKLMIFSVDGSVGKVLFAGKQNAGKYNETYDISSLAPGQYFYQLQTETELVTKPISMVSSSKSN